MHTDFQEFKGLPNETQRKYIVRNSTTVKEENEAHVEILDQLPSWHMDVSSFIILRAGLSTPSHHRLSSRFFDQMSDLRKFVHGFPTLCLCVSRVLGVWNLFGSSGSKGRLRQFPNLPRQLKSFRRRTSVLVSKSDCTLGHRCCHEFCQERRVQRFLRLASRLVCMGLRQRMWSMHREVRVVGCTTATASTDQPS